MCLEKNKNLLDKMILTVDGQEMIKSLEQAEKDFENGDYYTSDELKEMIETW